MTPEQKIKRDVRHSVERELRRRLAFTRYGFVARQAQLKAAATTLFNIIRKQGAFIPDEIL